MDEATSWEGRAVGEGRYALGRLLGEGSQGATFEAVDKSEGRPVAIKRFAVRGARSWKDVELAEREADVLEGLSHELLPAVRGRFEEDGALWLVMDLVEGRPLSEQPPLDRNEVVAFLHDVSAILDYLHRRAPPVIHRDIKPGNVIRRPARNGEPRDRYVLVDFGSVRQRLETKGGSTVVGTFGYMAPEQLQGRALPATDVYAAGATALRLLTGVEPEDLPHRGLAVDVTAALPGDPELAGLLGRMLAPDPDARASRIAPLLEGLDAPSFEPRPSPAPPPPPPPSGDAGAPREGANLPAALWGLFVVMSISLVRIVSNLVLRVILPTLFRLSYFVLGMPGRRAARRVDRFGKRVDDGLRGLRRRSTGLDPDGRRIRVEIDDEAAPKRRVDVTSVGEAAEELEAAAEELVEELQQELRRRRKRGP